MYNRSIFLMIFALIFAGVVAFLLRGKLDSGETEAAKTKVLVAVADVKAGSFVLKGKHLDWKAWPKDSISPSYLTQEKTKISEYDGAVARRNISAGEPITASALVKADDGGFLAAVMSPGMRAVSIAVSPTTGNAGFIQPGDQVDLILTHEVTVNQGENSEPVLASETFVRGVRVLAVDQNTDMPEKRATADNEVKVAKTVTIEVTSKQAEMVQVATRLGEISLSLRSLSVKAGDDEISPVLMETLTKDSDVSKLLQTRAGLPSRVQVIRGNEAEQIEFLK